MKPLQQLVRRNIQSLKPYSSARDEYKGVSASVFLDANENPYNVPYNRYPDPLQQEVKEMLAKLKGVAPEQIFLGNGSDEAIDLPYRIFCEPGRDNVMAIAPTYGMYKVCADINDVEYRPVMLNDDFTLDAGSAFGGNRRTHQDDFHLFAHNPSGQRLATRGSCPRSSRASPVSSHRRSLFRLLATEPFREERAKYPNIIVLNTFSKAWGCAAIRLGMAFASPDIIALFNKVKYPYNVNLLTQRQALEMMKQRYGVDKWVRILLQERPQVMTAFSELPVCEKVYPTDANFFLAKVKGADDIYAYLVREGIIVRNRSRVELCGDCLRITIGTPQENNRLLAALRSYKVQS